MVSNPRSNSEHLGAGLFSAILGVVLLLMLGGLYVADRALAKTSRGQAEIDANDSAAIVEQIVAARFASLRAFRVPLLDPAGNDLRTMSLLGDAFVREHPELLSLWVVDSHGQTLFEYARANGARQGSVRPEVPSDVERIHTRAEVLRGNGSHGGVYLVTPLTSGATTIGAAGAVLDGRELLEPVLNDQALDRTGLVLRRGQDTLWAQLPQDGRRELVSTSINVPGGELWVMEMWHTPASQKLRLTLWAFGVVAVLFLGTGVIRERRQTLRISERSSELERLSAELLRANRTKSEFLANVSHELRTPLNAIVGFVDLLRDGVYGEISPRQVPPVERIAASATHLRHLVDQVLDIAKIAAGRLEVHPETLSLRLFVLNVASELESLTNERGLTLSIAVPATLPRVASDPAHLRQVLVNLIGNAVKYTPDGGIAVRARLVGAEDLAVPGRMSGYDPTLLARSPDAKRPWVALQVIDSGIGIAPADQERIFDEFEQVNAGPRGDSMQRGTGLGLAISRRLARLIGGDLTVESQLGKGSTFTVWLPVGDEDLARRSENTATARENSASF